MLRLLRLVASFIVAAHGLVHAAIWPGAPAYGGGELGWTGSTWWSPPGDATILAFGRTGVWLVIALHLAAAVAILVARWYAAAPGLLLAAELGSLLTLALLWPGLTPTPMTFWLGPVISVALLPLVWVLWAAAAPGDRFARTWSARNWPATWGSTAGQRAEDSPASAWVDSPNFRVWRGVEVAASAELAAAWLAQLRFAPYSYDWIDNGGRQSPQVRTDDAPAMPANSFMGPFEVVETAAGGFTATSSGQPPMAFTYSVRSLSPDRCRIELALVARFETLLGALLLAYGDLVMMRRQLLNLARLAAAEARSPSSGGSLIATDRKP